MIRGWRSLLYIPGNNPGMLQNGGVYEADAVILDLEDAVAPLEKDAARLLVSEALARLDYSPSATVVRINALDAGGEDDLALVVPHGPAAILLPKAQAPEDIVQACQVIARFEPGPDTVRLLALIETPLGVLGSPAIASADRRVAGLAFGAEDYTAGLGVARTKAGTEISFARAMVINSAQTAGVPAYDTPFTDLADPDGLCQDTQTARALGFKGKLCIHPRQVGVVHQVFTPSPAEIAWADDVVRAFETAMAAGVGAVAVKGRMVDAPVVDRARQVLELARAAGWSEEVVSCETR